MAYCLLSIILHEAQLTPKSLSVQEAFHWSTLQIFTTNEPNGKSALENPTPAWEIPECVIHTENIACKNLLNNAKYDHTFFSSRIWRKK